MKISVGDREVDFVANAATPIYFKRIFHKDLFTEMMSAGDSGDTESQFALAFVMAKQAEGDRQTITALSDADFFEWLEGFSVTDLAVAMSDIVNVFNATRRSDSIPK